MKKKRMPAASRRRRLSGERLERRLMLASDVPFQNPGQELDVNRDLQVSPLDALQVINFIARNGSEYELPSVNSGISFPDVDGSDRVTPIDALRIINRIARSIDSTNNPILAARLVNDSAPEGRRNLDFITNQFDLEFRVTYGEVSHELQIRIDGESDSPFVPVAASLSDTSLLVSESELELIAGAPLEDGQHKVEARIAGSTSTLDFIITIDTEVTNPTPQAMEAVVYGELVDDLASFELSFGETMTPATYALTSYSLIATSGANSGQVVAIDSISQSGNNVRIDIHETDEDATFRLAIDAVVADLAGNPLPSYELDLRLKQPTLISEISPTDGETHVSTVRETIVRFNGPIDPATVNAGSFQVFAGGTPVTGRLVISSTAEFATFYYDVPLPSSTEVEVRIDGDVIADQGGTNLDADGDGIAGGVHISRFRTLSLTRLAATNVFGFVKDSFSGLPIEGATIRVDDFPSASVTTDQNGRFELVQMPSPEFFVHIDGSTATNAPAGYVYPNVGKPFHSVPGETVQLAMDGETFDVYLPPMSLGDIQPLAADQTTQVGFGDDGKVNLRRMFPDLPPEIFDRMRVSFAPGAATDDFGNPVTSATVIPVPPDRIPAPLPSNVNASLVVSIQAPGATGFDVPAPVSFPNVDGLVPGERMQILSFDHDAGRWTRVGTATVNADGQSVDSDPGVGIRAPGWHVFVRGIWVNGFLRLPGPGVAANGFFGGQALPLDTSDIANTTSVSTETYFAVELTDQGRLVRVEPNDNGYFQILLPELISVRIYGYDAVANLAGEWLVDTVAIPPFQNAGIQYLGNLVLGNAPIEDADSDGLYRAGEIAVGTLPDDDDSDDDGNNDLAELRAGTDPLAQRVLATSFLSRVNLPPPITTSDSISPDRWAIVQNAFSDGTGRHYSYLVSANEGFDLTTFENVPTEGTITVIDTTDPFAPAVVTQVVLPDSIDEMGPRLAVDLETKTLAVSTGTAGLLLYDISNPRKPVLRHHVNRFSASTYAYGGLIYIHEYVPLTVVFPNDRITVVDPIDGTVVQSFVFPNRRIGDFEVNDQGIFLASRSVIYYLQNNVYLPKRRVTVDYRPIAANGRIVEGGGSYLFLRDDSPEHPTISVNGDVITVGAIPTVSGQIGFATLELTPSGGVQLVAGPSDIAAPGAINYFQQDGSGNLVYTNNNELALFDLRDPTRTDQLIAGFFIETAVARPILSSGLAYRVSSSQFSVLNYAVSEIGGNGPQVSFVLPEIDVDPNTGGIQVTPGMEIPLLVRLQDNGIIRTARLLADGVVLMERTRGPWDFTYSVPPSAIGDRDLIQLQVIDGAGNQSLVDVGEFDVVADTFGPRIRFSSVTDGAELSSGVGVIEVAFNERIVTSPDAFLLRDTTRGTFVDLTLNTMGDTAVLSFDTLAPSVYELAVLDERITDTLGIHANTGNRTIQFTIEDQTAVWTNPAGGVWSDPSNWSGNRLPQRGDDVIIDVTGGGTVVVDDNAVVRSIVSNQALQITEGILQVTESIQVNNRFTIAGGTILDATILPGTGGEGLIATNRGGVLDNVTLDSDMTIDAGSEGELKVLVLGDLTVNGTLSVTGAGLARQAILQMGGLDQRILGTGEVVFRNGGGLQPLSDTLNLTLGQNLTVRGSAEGVSHAIGISVTQLINQGTIQFDGDGFVVFADFVTNQGAIMVAADVPMALLSTNKIVNTGTITSGARSKLVLRDLPSDNVRGVLVNNGTLSDGLDSVIRLEIDGLWNPSGLHRQGGTIEIAATLDNRNSTVQLNASTGSLVIDGGSILGGTIAPSLNGQQLVFTGNTANQLRDVIIQDEIVLENASLLLSGDWQNDGALTATDSVLAFEGNFTRHTMGQLNRTGGEILIAGTLNNVGSTLVLDSGTGSWTLAGGTLFGGQVELRDGAQLNFGVRHDDFLSIATSTLEDVTVNGDLDFDYHVYSLPGGVTRGQNEHFKAVGNVTINGQLHIRQVNLIATVPATVTLADSAQLNSAQLLVDSSASQLIILVGAGSTGTLGPDVSIRVVAGADFRLVGAGKLVQRGEILLEDLGILEIDIAELENFGLIRKINVVAERSSSTVLTNSGSVELLSGTLSFFNFTQMQAGFLRLAYGAGDNFATLNILNTATMDGTLTLLFESGTQPTRGQDYELINYSSRSGAFQDVTSVNLESGLVMEELYLATQLTVSVS